MKVPVIFRRLKDGELLALLPTVPSELREYKCKAFTMSQGFTDEDVALIKTSKGDKSPEQTPIMIELLKAGYEPTIVQRLSQGYENVRYRAFLKVRKTLKAPTHSKYEARVA